MIQEQRALIKMPDVAGLGLRKAELIIKNSGLQVDAVLFEESYDERNTVLRQRPARGQMVYVGEKVQLYVSRESYVKWLPSIYQRADITGRNFIRDLLWITQHLFGEIEDTLDIIHTYFDPLETPREFLPWIASWTAMVLEEDWPLEKKRKLIKRAIELYKVRGTVKGLKLFIGLFTGHEPEIIENAWPWAGFRVGVTSGVGVDTVILPAVNRAHTFLVQMPRSYKDVSIESVVRLHEIIQLEKPANTSYCLRFLAEERDLELREFFVIGERSGIGVGAEVVKPLPPGALVEEELIVAMKPSDAPVEETVDEFIAPNRGKAALPKAPKAENAPIEGQEVRTNMAGGFDAAAREIDLGEIERLLREQGVTTSTPGPELRPEAKPEAKTEAKPEATLVAEKTDKPDKPEKPTRASKSEDKKDGGGKKS